MKYNLNTIYCSPKFRHLDMKTSVTKLTSTGNIEKASSLLRAFGHPLRIKLLAYIHKQERVNVNRIYADLKLEQSVTSQHLRILRDEKLVISEREGKYIHYSINYDKIENIATVLDRFLATQ